MASRGAEGVIEGRGGGTEGGGSTGGIYGTGFKGAPATHGSLSSFKYISSYFSVMKQTKLFHKKLNISYFHDGLNVLSKRNKLCQLSTCSL